MFIHKILRGANAGLYLPFGLSRLRALYRRLGERAFFQDKYIIGDYTIEVQQTPPVQYVRIVQSGGAYFEFFTSGKPIVTVPTTQDGVTVTSYSVACVGVTMSADGGLKLESTIRGGKRFNSNATGSLVNRGAQVQLIDENFSLVPPRSGKRALYESYAPLHPYTGVFLRSFCPGDAGSMSNRGNFDTQVSRDVGYDVPYQDGTGIKSVRQAVLTIDADWPRANGVQTVVDPVYGSREFAVYVDAFSQFSVFPTSQITPVVGGSTTTQNVDAMYVRVAKPTLPSWVVQMSEKLKQFYVDSGGSAGYLDFPDIDWKLHPLGTKACAVVLERAAANYDAAYFATRPADASPPPGPFTSSNFNDYRDGATGSASRHVVNIQPTYLPQRYFYAPGLVEVAVNITLNGLRPQDFTINLVVTELRRPLTSPLCGMIAGYAWYDIIDKPAVGPVAATYFARAGELCILDIERYYDPATGNADSMFSLKNLTTATEVATYGGSRLMDYDMTTLSFVFMFPAYQTVLRSVPPRSGAPSVITTQIRPYTIVHPSATVWTMGKFRETLYPATIPDAIKTAIDAAASSRDRRASLTAATFMPLNYAVDLTNWEDPVALSGLGGFRNWYTVNAGWRKPGPGVSAPSAAISNWWAASGSYLPLDGLFFVTDPRYGWATYTDEIISRLGCGSHSTFFTHPNGSWAFFDQSMIYNAFGDSPSSIDGDHDYYIPFDATKLEHVILDRVHLVLGSNAKNTSFTELYNAAVPTANALGLDVFTTISNPSDFQAAFTKQSFTDPGVGKQNWLDLQVVWNGVTLHYPDLDYKGGVYDGGAIVGGYTEGGGLTDLTLEAPFFTAAGYGGDIVIPHADQFPLTFSSCLMIEATTKKDTA